MFLGTKIMSTKVKKATKKQLGEALARLASVGIIWFAETKNENGSITCYDALETMQRKFPPKLSAAKQLIKDKQAEYNQMGAELEALIIADAPKKTK